MNNELVPVNDGIKEMLRHYNIQNGQDEINAIKEILQEIILCALSRGNFFDEAAFYGGTALRIFYGLNRFSEDLDFSLLAPNKNFDFSKYFSYIEEEALLYGLNVTLSSKKKTKESKIDSAFLKGDTKEHILLFFPIDNHMDNSKLLKDIKIKFEADINPPSGATYVWKSKTLPIPHKVRVYDDASLFAGKISAVLCRNWQTRSKGRDLYDYIFFISMKTPINLELLKNKLIEADFISKTDVFNLDILKKILKNKFKEIDYESAKKDVSSFIKDQRVLDAWDAEFFIDITDQIK